MKKFLALVLSAVLVIGLLAGCGDGKSKATSTGLEGKWLCNMDMTDMLNEMMASSGAGEMFNLSDFQMPLTLELKADGTYVMSVDEAGLKDSMNGLKEQMKDSMTAYLEQSLAGTGMSVEDALAATGMDMDELMDQAFSEESLSGLLDNATAEGKYKAEDGKLYTSDSLSAEPGSNYVEYTQQGDTLTLDAGNGEVPSSMADFLPLTFSRMA